MIVAFANYFHMSSIKVPFPIKSDEIVQTWKSQRQEKNRDYTSDPFHRGIQNDTNSSHPYDCLSYSSENKSFNPVVPYNSIDYIYDPIRSFDISRLPQTSLTDLFYKIIPPKPSMGSISLAKTVIPLVNKIGSIINSSNGLCLGTCTLIAHNLILAPRHAIEETDISKLKVTLDNTNYSNWMLASIRKSKSSFLDGVVEDSPDDDYAVLSLKVPLGKHLGYAPLSSDEIISPPALLHHPLGKPLRISVNEVQTSAFWSLRSITYHDTDYASSGGAYCNPFGKMVAMHLGSELSNESMHLKRYALPFSNINPESILGKLISGDFPQNLSYRIDSSCKYLKEHPHNYFIDEEGRESEKILRGLLKDVTDKKIKRTKNGKVSTAKGKKDTSDDNLSYISKKYPEKIAELKKKCLGVTGCHSVTRLYSVSNLIDSDHTIPHEVWKSTTHEVMQKIVKDGTGKRKGEGDMPAITIPHEIHAKLLTTGSSLESIQFRNELTELCDKGHVDEALIKCYYDYKQKGLNFNENETALKNLASHYVNKELITEEERSKIIDEFF